MNALSRTLRLAARPLDRASLPLAVILLALAGCGRDEGAASPAAAGDQRTAAVPVTLAPVRYDDVDRTVSVIGSIYGDEQVLISAEVPGRISRIVADVGDRVAEGAVLARIDPTDYQLMVDQKELALREALARLGASAVPESDFDVEQVPTVVRAKAESANAMAKLERARKLHEQKPPLISDQDFSDIATAADVSRGNYDVALLEARSQVAQARARASDLALAREQLEDTYVRAPAEPPTTRPVAAPATMGQPSAQSAATHPAATAGGSLRYAVTERTISEGEYVRTGDPLYRLVADDPVKYRATVAEQFLPQVKVGQPVHLRVEGYDRTFTGAVSRINPAVDPDSRNFTVEVLVPNDARLLRPGAFARGQIVIGSEGNVPFVPRSAVVSFAGVDRVYSIAGGKAVEHVVQLGEARGDHVAIKKGLADAQQVVTTGSQRLSDGAAVEETTRQATQAAAGQAPPASAVAAE